jgi:hypothetical protein
VHPDVRRDDGAAGRVRGRARLPHRGDDRKQKDIKKFAHGGLRIQWHPDDPLIHSTYFVLVDREGLIRDYFNQTRRDEMKRLRKVIRTLLGEKTP